jgi:hypothetical protein
VAGQHIEPDLKTAGHMSFGQPFLSTSPACAKRAMAIYARNHSPIQTNIKVKARARALPHPAAEPTITPPTVGMATVVTMAFAVTRLLNNAALAGAGLQRLKRVGCRRSV